MARHILILTALAGALALASDAVAAPEGGASIEGVQPGSAENMLQEAKDTIVFVQDGLRRASKVRDQADRDSDGKLSDCIAAPYNGLRTLERVATDRLEEMQNMIADGDTANAGRVFRSMVIIRDKASAHIAQADACTADGQVNGGNSTVDANTDALTDEDDTSPLLDDVTVDIDPPPVTPFQ